MVMKLRLTTAIRDDQTLLSHVGELALMNFQPSTDDFCRDMRTTLHAVAMGEPDAISNIAQVSGNDAGTLERAAFKRRDGRTLVFRSQTLTKQARMPMHVRFCTECLTEDIDLAAALGMRRPYHHAYGRPHWHAAQYRTCVKHGLQLASVGTGPGHRQHDFAGAVLPLLDRLDEIGSSQIHRSASGLEQYLEKRILNGGGDDFLDGLGFSVTARFCEMLGAVALFGPWPPHLGFTDEQWQLAGSAGYQIASKGSPAITTFLAGLKETAERDSRDGAHNDWGILYNWMNETRDPELEPLLEVARDHIEMNYPVGVGKGILGRQVRTRKMHSVHSASVEYGVHGQVMRTQLAAAGVIEDDPSKTDNLILFPAGPNRTLLERLSRGVSALHAQQRINCDRQVFGPLVEAGLLTPIAPVQSGYPLFDKADLDAFVEGLLAKAVPYSTKPAGLETISAARMKMICSHPDIVKLIQSGKLTKVGRLENEWGYAAVLVDHAEIAPLVRGAELGGIVVTYIAADLGIPHAGMVKMLDVHLPTQRRMHPQRRCLQQIVEHAVYAAFKAKYVSLRDLSRDAGVNSRKFEVQLRHKGITPEPGFPKKVHLYLRSRLG
jgi:hypothetical protein